MESKNGLWIIEPSEWALENPVAFKPQLRWLPSLPL